MSGAQVSTSRWGASAKRSSGLASVSAVITVTTALFVVPLRDRPLSAVLIFLFVVLIVSALWGFRYAVFVSLIEAVAFSLLVPPVRPVANP
jgi:uncharacterized membrane protein YhaH (DUF805 family)